MIAISENELKISIRAIEWMIGRLETDVKQVHPSVKQAVIDKIDVFKKVKATLKSKAI